MSYQGGPVLWSPSAEWIERTTLSRYMNWLSENRGLSYRQYDELWRWSVTDLEGFWKSVWDFFAVHSSTRVGAVLEGHMPSVRWFAGASINYARHVFADKPDNRVCVVHTSESGPVRYATWRELRELTGRVRVGLLNEGVRQGDRVAGYLGNRLETLAAMLATVSLGGIWSCISPEMGPRSALDRLSQIDPVVLLAADGYRYNRREFDRRHVVAELERSLESVRRTVFLDVLGTDEPHRLLSRGMSWGDFTASSAELEFQPVPFDHPLWILYSSGTTGPPKPIVHGHGGILLEHLKKLHIHTDLQPDDRFMWFSTTGWMMWNFLVSGLLTDATIVLYDGSPQTDSDGLWDVVERTQTTIFGTSAGYLTGCMNSGICPREGHDLSALRAIGSTGSPLIPEAFDWVYEQLGPEMWLFSTSGGTDVCSSFLGGVPILPVRRGELQGRALGAKVEAFDPDGSSLVGVVGELVLTEPLPSMPLFLWGDVDGTRYRSSYFSTYEGVWRHGDWILITESGGAVIYGRSDATINRGGVRIGTAEIYRSLQAVPDLLDALAVDVPLDGGRSWLGLFVVLGHDTVLDERRRDRIRSCLREDCSPRHVPDAILQVSQVPRTMSGKLLEIPVKRILMGHSVDEVASPEALGNPHALDTFVALARSGLPVDR